MLSSKIILYTKAELALILQNTKKPGRPQKSKMRQQAATTAKSCFFTAKQKQKA
jgi:hypothetical protein